MDAHRLHHPTRDELGHPAPDRGFGSWTGPLSLFGAQVAPMGGAGAYQRTPGNYGLHAKTRFDTDLLEPQYVGPSQISLKLRLTEHA